MSETRRKPSEILVDMKKKQQAKETYRDTETGKVCFSGFIMKEWGLFNHMGGVELFEYDDILDKMLVANGQNPIGSSVDGKLAVLNDTMSFESGRKAAIEYLRSLGL